MRSGAAKCRRRGGAATPQTKNGMSAAPLAPTPAPMTKKHNLHTTCVGQRADFYSVLHSELDHTASRTTPRKDASTSFKPLFAPAFPVSFEKRS